MSTRTAVMLIVLLATGSSVAAQAAGGSTPEDSVRAVEQSRAQALLHADTAALSRMVADEFIEISRLGQLRTKADNIRDIGNGDLRSTRRALAGRRDATNPPSVMSHAKTQEAFSGLEAGTV